MFDFRRKKRENGFSLVELLLVFAVIISASVITFLTAAKLARTQQALLQSSDIELLDKSIQHAYLGANTYGGMTTANLLPLLPPRMNKGNVIASIWGGDIQVGPGTIYTPDDTYYIYIPSVPAQECVTLVTKLDSRFEMIYIGPYGGTGAPVKEIGTVPAFPPDVAAACRQSPGQTGNSILFFGPVKGHPWIPPGAISPTNSKKGGGGQGASAAIAGAFANIGATLSSGGVAGTVGGASGSTPIGTSGGATSGGTSGTNTGQIGANGPNGFTQAVSDAGTAGTSLALATQLATAQQSTLSGLLPNKADGAGATTIIMQANMANAGNAALRSMATAMNNAATKLTLSPAMAGSFDSQTLVAIAEVKNFFTQAYTIFNVPGTVANASLTSSTMSSGVQALYDSGAALDTAIYDLLNYAGPNMNIQLSGIQSAIGNNIRQAAGNWAYMYTAMTTNIPPVSYTQNGYNNSNTTINPWQTNSGSNTAGGCSATGFSLPANVDTQEYIGVGNGTIWHRHQEIFSGSCTNTGSACTAWDNPAPVCDTATPPNCTTPAPSCIQTTTSWSSSITKQVIETYDYACRTPGSSSCVGTSYSTGMSSSAGSIDSQANLLGTNLTKIAGQVDNFVYIQQHCTSANANRTSDPKCPQYVAP